MRHLIRTTSLMVACQVCVAAANAQAPVANDDTYSVPYATALVVEVPGVLANDTAGGGPAADVGGTAELLAGVLHGVLSCPSDVGYQLCPDGSFDYTPDPSFPGFDTFTYQVVVGADTSQATVTLSACSAGPTQFVCWAEAPYLAKLAELGYGTFQEGFEDDVAWGLTRLPDSSWYVISQGVKWESNHPTTNRITTGIGPARTGAYGVYDPDHGYATGTVGCDTNSPPPECLFKDGFTGTREAGQATLYGAGGYFEGSAQPNLAMILDGGAAIGLGRLSGGGHQFFGVIDTGGFTSFRVEETDGKVGQSRLVFGDDFTLGTTPVDTTPPTVTLVNTLLDTGDGQLSDGELASVAITELYVRFSEQVQDSGTGAPGDATNPANVLLFDDNGDGFDTPDCIGGVASGDHQIPIDALTFLSGSQLELTAYLNGGTPLPTADYRLLVCGSTSVRDWAGNPLDGDGNGVGGDDFRLDFSVFLNEPPLADDQSVTTAEDTGKAITLSGSDPDAAPSPLTFSIFAGPSHGTLSGTPPSVTYDPDPNYNGPDSFKFRAYDGLDYSNIATVSVTVTAVNDAPVAAADGYAVARGGTLVVAAPGLLGNDVDVDGDALSAVLEPATGPGHAVGFTLNADGSVTYTHDGSATLADSFQYRASDGLLSSAPVTVSITVAPGPTTWYVATTGNDLNDCLTALSPCLTVQEAVARAAGGDTISLAAGTYSVTSLIVDKNLAIVGAGSTTVLNGGGAGVAISAMPGVTMSWGSLVLADTP